MDQLKPWVWASVVTELGSPPALPYPDHQEELFGSVLTCSPNATASKGQGQVSYLLISSLKHLYTTPSSLDNRASSIVLPRQGAGPTLPNGKLVGRSSFPVLMTSRVSSPIALGGDGEGHLPLTHAPS